MRGRNAELNADSPERRKEEQAGFPSVVCQGQWELRERWCGKGVNYRGGGCGRHVGGADAASRASRFVRAGQRRSEPGPRAWGGPWSYLDDNAGAGGVWDPSIQGRNWTKPGPRGSTATDAHGRRERDDARFWLPPSGTERTYARPHAHRRTGSRLCCVLC
jgi:hypothetical protein